MTQIPEHTENAIERYVNERIPPGGFLTAVLSNDLAGAVARADMYNREALSDIVQYIYNRVPASAWGSPKAVSDSQ